MLEGVCIDNLSYHGAGSLNWISVVCCSLFVIVQVIRNQYAQGSDLYICIRVNDSCLSCGVCMCEVLSGGQIR